MYKKKLFFRTVMQHLQPFTTPPKKLKNSPVKVLELNAAKRSDGKVVSNAAFCQQHQKVREPRGRGRHFDEETVFFCFFGKYI